MTRRELALSFEPSDIRNLKSALNAHRRACGPSCVNGDEIAETIRIWEDAHDQRAEDEHIYQQELSRQLR